MVNWRRLGFLIAAWLLLCFAAAPADARNRMLIRGIVDYVHEDVITVGEARHDISGVPVRNADGTAAERGDALRGKLVEIRNQRGKIVSVTVFPPMPY